MTLTEINEVLNNLRTCGDPTFEKAAAYIQGLITQIQNAKLSKQEATELLKDVQRQLQIVQDAQQVDHKELLNTAITSLLIILTLGINNL